MNSLPFQCIQYDGFDITVMRTITDSATACARSFCDYATKKRVPEVFGNDLGGTADVVCDSQLIFSCFWCSTTKQSCVDTEGRCGKCGSRRHTTGSCTVDVSKIRCFRCRKAGHVSYNCPSRGKWKRKGK